MADTWNYDHLIYDKVDKNILKHIADLFDSKLPGFSEAVIKGLNLYKFLLKHMDIPIENLHKSITINGDPMFTIDDLDIIRTKLKSQSDIPFVKHILQKGGSSLPVPPTTAPGHGLDDDPSRSKFWDKMIRKLTWPLAKHIPVCMNPFLEFMFILYNLEQHPQYGILISTYLDTITLSIPAVADLVSDMISKFGGTFLGALPGGGSAANIIAMVIMAMFCAVGATLNVSRKHFGAAFKTALDGIPIIGEALSTGSIQIETGVERYLQNRDRVLNQIEPTMPRIAKFVEYWTPTPDIVEGPSPPMSIDVLKAEAGDAIERSTGMNVNTALKDPIGALDAVAKPVIAPFEAATGIDVNKVVRDPFHPSAALPSMPTTDSLTAVATSKLPSVPSVDSFTTAATNKLPSIPSVNSFTTAATNKLPSVPSVESLTPISSASSVISKSNGSVAFKPTPIRKRGGKTRRSKQFSHRMTKKNERW